MAEPRTEGGPKNASQDGGGPPPWMTRHLWQIQPVRDVLVLAAVFGVLYLGHRLSIVTVPLLLGLTFAYLFEPIVQRMTRSDRVSRQGAATFIIAAVVFIVVAPISLGLTFGVAQGVRAIEELTRNAAKSGVVQDVADALVTQLEAETITAARVEFPDDQRRMEIVVEPPGAFEPPNARFAPADTRPLTLDLAQRSYAQSSWPFRFWCRYMIAQKLGDHEAGRPVAQADEPVLFTAFDLASRYVQGNSEALTSRAFGTGVGAAGAAIRTVTSLGLLAFMAFLTAFFFFFISISYSRVLAFLRSLIPSKNKEQYLNLLGQMDQVIAGFIRGRITIAFIQSFIFTTAYWLVGVPAPLILGPLVAILSIVPYLALVGIPISIVLMLLESHGVGLREQWWWILSAPTVVYFAGQALDDYVWTPRIQGKATGMDTPTILFASIAGGALMGVYGLLLAIPVAACLKILLRDLFWPRFKAWSEGKEKDFLPIGRGSE
ncbi:MAG: AI-2E family transporter [Planctomycetes bacterium]|nr:AI-2E family transporter [Planctomycetota bacterium]